MIDEVTGNKILECPIGFFDYETETFLVVERILDLASINQDWHVVVLNHDDDIRDKEVYRIIYEFNKEDITDCFNMTLKVQYAKVKVQRDKENEEKLEAASR
jgi:hypothetical protein